MKNYKVIEKSAFNEIKADEGFVLVTPYEDIKDYNSSTIMCCPKSYDYSAVYTITVEEDEQLKIQKEEALEVQRALDMQLEEDEKM